MNDLYPPYPWQSAQWARLCDAVRRDNLAHAYLCTGPKGLGKVDFALAFLKTLLCPTGVSQGMPCDHCKSCHLFDCGSHPDFSHLQPEAGSQQIKIEQCRELI